MWKDILNDLKEKQEVRKNLIQIKDLIKEEKSRKELSDLLAGNSIFMDFLQDEDPKVRKNAALILGQLKSEGGLEALAGAYEKEDILFVRNAYLTAMSCFDYEKYRPMLEERYQEILRMETGAEEKKHIREERRELEQMLRPKEGCQFHTFGGYELESEVVLTVDRGFAQITAEQIHAGRKAVSNSAVRVRTKNLRPLLEIRTYRELLFPLPCGIIEDSRPERIAGELLEGGLLEMLDRYLEGSGSYYFILRIMSAALEENEKTRLLKRTVFELEEGSHYRLLNAKDHYEVEIRLMENRDGNFRPYLKFYTLPMKRFSYRAKTLPVSIHPALAALLLRLAKPYLREDAAVLDPFCGVGTMLIERERLLHARTLYGIDFYGEAIRGAKDNAQIAEVPVHYLQKDFFQFQHRHRFDEIVTNMPMRGKKSKQEQDQLYERFFQKVQEHLLADGVIIMYSNENGFVKKQLRLHKNLKLLKEYCIREREGFYLFIIGEKE